MSQNRYPSAPVTIYKNVMGGTGIQKGSTVAAPIKGFTNIAGGLGIKDPPIGAKKKSTGRKSRYKKPLKLDLKEGAFTAQAKRANMGVQEFASHVMANKDKFSPTTVKRANFAKVAKKWKKG